MICTICSTPYGEQLHKKGLSIGINVEKWIIKGEQSLNKMLELEYERQRDIKNGRHNICRPCNKQTQTEHELKWRNLPKYLHIELCHYKKEKEYNIEIHIDTINEENMNVTLQKIFQETNLNSKLICISWFEQVTEGIGHYFISKKIKKNQWIDINDNIVNDITDLNLKERIKSTKIRAEILIFMITKNNIA